MNQVFTDKLLNALKPAQVGKRYYRWDGKLQNFGVRVTDNGVVSFVVMRRLPGRKTPTRVTLGRYPALGLAAARKKAGDAIDELAGGEHPRERKALQQAAETRQRANSVEHVVERFLTERAADARTAKAIRQLLEKKVVTRWGSKPIASITKSDVNELVADVRLDVRKRRKTAGVEAARQALIYVKSLFSWAAEMDIINASPAASIRLSGKKSKLLPTKKSRERTLDDAEIKSLWQATEGDDYPLNPYVRLLLILGVRRTELAEMTRNEINLDTGIWCLTGDRTKNKEPRTVFLPQMAINILRELPEFTGPFVFSTTGGYRPISGFAKLKARLDKRLTDILPWRLHDLRRTMRTGLSTLQVPHLVAELAIGHKQRGLDAVYDKHRYEPEQREALDKWCAKLTSIVTPPPDNVTALNGRRGKAAAA
jgi:integrase